jgi:FdhD protein
MHSEAPRRTPIRIGISACLLGQQVRYDGGHKRDAFLADVLSRQVEFIPVCPEVEMGLGTPREPMRLERRDGSVRMITITTRIDHTPRLQAWAASRLDDLAAFDLSGYIFKADSPSCGPDGVKVFDDDSRVESTGRGLFAAALRERFPGLPVEDERRLADPAVRDDFMRRVIAYHRRSLASVRTVSILRVGSEGPSRTSDPVAVEEPLEIRLHDRPFAVVMRTPGADRELAAGFLLSEGIISGAQELGAVEHCRHPDRTEAHNVVNVFLLGEARERLDEILSARRIVATNTSCGMCGRVTMDAIKTRVPPISTRSTIAATTIPALIDALRREQSVFDETGGIHGAALLTMEGQLVCAAEDVGRHNAVDKVIGRLLLEERLPLPGHALAVSGRTSFEIVQKAWLAGIEILCAVSAPSSLAVEIAHEAGITLIGFARPSGFNVYSHPDRLAWPASDTPDTSM